MKNKWFKILCAGILAVCMFAFTACVEPLMPSNIYIGEEEPTIQEYYKVNDIYINETNGNVYKYTTEGWVLFEINLEHENLVKNEEEFVLQVKNTEKSKVIKLEEDLVLTKGVTIDTNITIELNGHNISAPTDEIGDGVFYVVENGKLTINGEGTINGVNATEYAMAIWVNGGEVVINGGTYTNVEAGEDTQYDLIYVKNGGKITINGGTFISQTPKWTLNNHDRSGGEIIVKGGSFFGYNPSCSETENPIANFVADGYTVNEVLDENGTWYVVSIVEETEVETETEETVETETQE